VKRQNTGGKLPDGWWGNRRPSLISTGSVRFFFPVKDLRVLIFHLILDSRTAIDNIGISAHQIRIGRSPGKHCARDVLIAAGKGYRSYRDHHPIPGKIAVQHQIIDETNGNSQLMQAMS
jgi:hypothetical protein